MKTIYNKLMGLIFSPSTPIQLFLVAVLGFIFGFIPGFTYAPFLFILLIFLVLILRVNIGLFVLIALLAKILSYPLEFISFTLGRWLLNGFTQPIFKVAVNTPVLSYAGFDYYLVAGAFILSIVLGIAFGIFIAKLYRKFIDKMAEVQAGSELYQKLAKKLVVKIGSRIVFGKNIAKVDWKKIQTRKFRQPIRIWGLTVVVILVLAVAFVPKIIETAMVSTIIKQQLTEVNGATVGYDSIALSLSDARLEINGLGAADPENLHKDRFYAKSISASIDITRLLTKQIALKDVVIDGISLEHSRYLKGVLHGSESTAPVVPSDEYTTNAIDKVKAVGANFEKVDITKITKNAEKSVSTAKDVKQVVDLLSNFKSNKTGENDKPVAKEIKTEAKVYGYANVRNESLRDQAPSFAIANMYIKGLKNQGVIYDVRITNLSKNPALLAKPTDIHIQSTSNKDVDFNLLMSNQSGVKNTVKFYFKNFDGDFLRGLTIQGVGIDFDSVNVSGAGTWHFTGMNNIMFNIPLKLKLNNVGINLSQVKQKISDLTLKAILSGDLSNVGFGVDISNLKDILSAETVKNVAGGIVKQIGLDKHGEDLISKTTINGKSIKDLNSKDVKKLASKFGIKF